MTIHVHKKFRRALSFANNIRLAEPKMKPGIECIRKYVSRKNIYFIRLADGMGDVRAGESLGTRETRTNNEDDAL